jgi:hypothetical protein
LLELLRFIKVIQHFPIYLPAIDLLIKLPISIPLPIVLMIHFINALIYGLFSLAIPSFQGFAGCFLADGERGMSDSIVVHPRFDQIFMI